MKKRCFVFLLIFLLCLQPTIRVLAGEIPTNGQLPLWPDPIMTPLLTGQNPDIDPETAKEIMTAIYTFIHENQEEWAENKILTFNDMIKLAKEIQAVYPNSIPIPAVGGGPGFGITNGVPYLSVGIPFAVIYAGGFGVILNSGIALPIIPLSALVIGMPYVIAFHVIWGGDLRYWLEGYWNPYLIIPFIGGISAHYPPGDTHIYLSFPGVSLNLFIYPSGEQYFNIYIPLGWGTLSSDSQLNNLSSDEIVSWFPETMEIMEKFESAPLTAAISDQDKQTIQNEAAVFKSSFAIAP